MIGGVEQGEHTLPEELQAELDDGTRVTFRVLRPEDRDLIKRGLTELSPESRYRRFFHAVDKLTDKQLDYLTKIDYVNHFAWVAHLTDDPSRGLGVARWVRATDDPEMAEAAVTVIDPFQNRGIGNTLLRLTTASAVERGIRYFRAWALGENHPMMELLKNFGAVPGKWESGVLEMVIPLPDDVAEIEDTPAPFLLRAVAAGRLHGEARSEDIARMRFIR